MWPRDGHALPRDYDARVPPLDHDAASGVRINVMSNDTTLYTVGEVAERFSLTVRTLHHWEAQGLLAPTARSWSNYRLYSAEDCARVQRIVIYRATGMKLIDIKSLLDSGDTAVEHLKRQRERLVAHRRETDAMIKALDILLEDAMNDNELTLEEVGKILGDADFAAHQSEAEERYGDTADWRESRERTASWQSADWRQNAERFHDIERRMIDAIRDGAAPDSERAAGLVEEHREALSEFFPVTPAKHYIMSRGYIHDERFREHYDSQQVGFAQWLADAIEAVARQQGVDIENPTWE